MYAAVHKRIEEFFQMRIQGKRYNHYRDMTNWSGLGPIPNPNPNPNPAPKPSPTSNASLPLPLTLPP